MSGKHKKRKKTKKTLSKTNILDMIFLLIFYSVFENLKNRPGKMVPKRMIIR
ncbi:MAG: hypothetical protein OP8BY_1089 [Candidatus Saccharicenans subterraneus]|uniref:Uncharacterized protein n=1 Tax=Candidatus Saccharicenans subterraneus TaxID=2508984 RepID=A0A3E2BR78_9BACT|nr:MAG: hypothetical protein OP8BY_1089 [Candidatus Saccharicenans subterraneum]